MTEVDSFTVKRDARSYHVSVLVDECPDNPRGNDHSATQFYVTGYGYSRWETYVDELDGDAGDALRHFIEKYGASESDTIARAFSKWRAITGSSVVLASGQDHGYTQGAWHRWFALVDTDVMTRDGYTCTPEKIAELEADDYAAYAFGDVFGLVVTLNGSQIDDGWLWGIVDRKGDYVRELAGELVDAHEKTLHEQANLAGAGFLGVI